MRFLCTSSQLKKKLWILNHVCNNRVKNIIEKDETGNEIYI